MNGVRSWGADERAGAGPVGAPFGPLGPREVSSLVLAFFPPVELVARKSG